MALSKMAIPAITVLMSPYIQITYMQKGENVKETYLERLPECNNGNPVGPP